LQLSGNPLAQRPAEHGIVGRVPEIGEHDSIFPAELGRRPAENPKPCRGQHHRSHRRRQPPAPGATWARLPGGGQFRPFLQGCEGLTNFRGAVPAPFRIYRQAVGHNRLQTRFARNRRTSGRCRPRADGHLVQHEAEGPQVGTEIDFVAARLLGSHIGRCSQDGTGAGRHGQLGKESGGPNLRKTEIEDLRLPASREKQIRRLDVPMHDPRRMGCIQRVGHLNADAEQFLQSHRAARDPFAQGFALQVFHDHERAPFELDDIVQCADVRVVERGGRTRLHAEPGQRRGVVCGLAGEGLKCDVPVQPCIQGLVHDTDSARAQFAFHPVV